MNNNTKLAMTSRKRTENGTYLPSDYGKKTMRSMRLTDECWDLLEKRGINEGKTRSDIVEDLARGSNNQAIILRAIAKFIELQESDYGDNPAQKGKAFNTTTRNWAAFNKFAQLIKDSPWELGISSSMPSEGNE